MTILLPSPLLLLWINTLLRHSYILCAWWWTLNSPCLTWLIFPWLTWSPFTPGIISTWISYLDEEKCMFMQGVNAHSRLSDHILIKSTSTLHWSQLGVNAFVPPVGKKCPNSPVTVTVRHYSSPHLLLCNGTNWLPQKNSKTGEFLYLDKFFIECVNLLWRTQHLHWPHSHTSSYFTVKAFVASHLFFGPIMH